MKKILFQQPDLDTCLAALIIAGGRELPVEVRRTGASRQELDDPDFICIEAGGSGEIENSNFDHHDPIRYHAPACRQALLSTGNDDPALARLIDYVCLVDEAKPHPLIPFPSLSGLFSGMRLVEKYPEAQFWEGIAILKTVIEKNLNPFATLPELPEWRRWIEEKKKNAEELEISLENAHFFETEKGTQAGFLAAGNGAIGGMFALYRRGCAVGILFHPAFGEPPVRKFTIAGDGVPVAGLLPHLDRLESGWGGRGTIIGSPRAGSRLPEEEVISLVKKYL